MDAGSRIIRTFFFFFLQIIYQKIVPWNAAWLCFMCRSQWNYMHKIQGILITKVWKEPHSKISPSYIPWHNPRGQCYSETLIYFSQLYRLNYFFPLTSYVGILNLGSQNVTIFGNKTFKSVVKIKWGHMCGPWCNLTVVLVRRGE